MRVRVSSAVVAALVLALATPADAAEIAGRAHLDPAAKVAATYPLANTFTLHSLPGSQRTIFLDFDGNTVADGSWSETMTGIQAKAYPGFNLEGSAATFSEGEQNFIQQVWRRVAEAYSPFSVDVTTQDPGPAAISRTDPSDQTFGVQVAITTDTAAADAACGSGSTCAGFAPLGTFDEVESSPSEHQPAWVFASNTYPDLTYSNSASLTAESAAHEAGHTLGLDHDATSANPNYYAGHANWFPIMGQTLGRTSIGQWSKGEYAGATNTEDDLAIIAAGGAPARADDYPDASGTPFNLGSPATSGNNAFVRRGVISTDADTDWFTFNRGCSGPMLVKATGIGYGATVDLKLTVTNAAGTVIATNNPASGQVQVYPDPFYRATGLDASALFSRAASGSYRVKVEGVGSGDPQTTGYSGYGSLGQYTLTVTRCSTPLASVKKPGAPVIGKASPGRVGKPVNAVARWAAPRSDGGAPITRYRLRAVKVNARGEVLKSYLFTAIKPRIRSITVRLPAGRYKFRVAATNRVGTGAYSAYSKIVRAR